MIVPLYLFDSKCVDFSHRETRDVEFVDEDALVWIDLAKSDESNATGTQSDTTEKKKMKDLKELVLQYSQTQANKATSEQRPPVNNVHKFRVPRVVVVHRFDCTSGPHSIGIS